MENEILTKQVINQGTNKEYGFIAVVIFYVAMILLAIIAVIINKGPWAAISILTAFLGVVLAHSTAGKFPHFLPSLRKKYIILLQLSNNFKIEKQQIIMDELDEDINNFQKLYYVKIANKLSLDDFKKSDDEDDDEKDEETKVRYMIDPLEEEWGNGIERLISLMVQLTTYLNTLGISVKKISDINIEKIKEAALEKGKNPFEYSSLFEKLLPQVNEVVDNFRSNLEKRKQFAKEIEYTLSWKDALFIVVNQ